MLPPSQRLEHESQRLTTCIGALRCDSGSTSAAQTLAMPTQRATAVLAIAAFIAAIVAGESPAGNALLRRRLTRPGGPSIRSPYDENPRQASARAADVLVRVLPS